MAGGVGSRFWPQSTTQNPKQFLDVLGTGRTLLQQTYDRFSHFIPDENILVVTNDLYTEMVESQLPEISTQNILSEPSMRNTAPCLAYAVKKIESKNPMAQMVVTPSDHLITNGNEFNKVMELGFDYVANNDDLLTIGIKPNRPNTGYGYIEYNKRVNHHVLGVTSVIQFKEKPDIETASNYLSAGNFSWNSGMFLWNVSTILKSFKNNAPEVLAPFEGSEGVFYTEKEQDYINSIYDKCPVISIDYAILEKAENVKVINAEIGWSDIGTWVALQEHIPPTKGNFVIQGKTLLSESHGNIISVDENRVVATKGINDLIIVESDGVLMIVTKHNEQEIKKLRQMVGESFGEDLI